MLAGCVLTEVADGHVHHMRRADQAQSETLVSYTQLSQGPILQ